MLNAQHQGDRWFFGDSAGIVFTPGGPIADTNGILSTQEASASISSKNGDLLFYVASYHWNINDSLVVRNRYHQIMPNGTGIKGYSSCTQGSLILPMSSDSNKYFVIGEERYWNPGLSRLFYSIVDMTLDSGKGDVAKKNILLSSSNFTEKLIAVKHANGRDWWLLVHEYNTSAFYKFLLTDSVLIFIDSQSIGTIYNNSKGFLGQMIFSKDGDKLLCAGNYYVLDLFDFDRCTGTISNWIDLGILNHPPSNSYYGCSFSESGDRIYLSGVDSLFQFDLTSANIAASKTFMWKTIGSSQGIGQHLISPYGKIYIANYPRDTTVYYIHVIEKPNDLYPACTFVPYGFYLGGRKSRFGLPNMPNYNLGALAGSPCDTLTAIAELNQYDNEIKIYPNPAKSNFTFEYNIDNKPNAKLRVENILGVCVKSLALSDKNHEVVISTSNLAEGIYILKLVDGNTLIYSTKLIVIK